MSYFFDLDANGGKLKGLLDIPPSWTPEFFAICGALHDRWLQAGARISVEAGDLLDGVERNWIQRRVAEFGDQPEYMSLIVRSDAEHEGLEQRGLMKSIRCDGTVEAIFSAALEVFAAALDAGVSSSVNLLVQLFLGP